MIVTIVMKASFQRFQPRIIHYRDYRRFQNDVFREELLSELLNINNGENKGFPNFLDIPGKKNLHYDTPCKQKHAPGNHLPFIEMITIKESFQNKAITVRLLLENPKSYSTLDEKKVRENKTFWKTIKPFLFDKIALKNKVT